jgi:hypothetical protein
MENEEKPKETPEAVAVGEAPRSSFRIPLAILTIGVGMLVAGSMLLGRSGDVGWQLTLIGVGAALCGLGFRLSLGVFIDRYGSIHVPTWLGIVILLLMLAILPIVAIFSWIVDK